MRVRALAIRIIQQFFHDKRSIALMFVAPVLILTLISLVFNAKPLVPDVGLVSVPAQMKTVLTNDGAVLHDYRSESSAKADLKEQELDAYVVFSGDTATLAVEGSDPVVTQAVVKWTQQSMKSLPSETQQLQFDTVYLHGSRDMTMFDSFGAVLVGFFAFFFVFLLSGISFLRERTGGTLERLICSPMRLWEIVAGYVIGFGVFTVIQSIIITAYSVYVLDLPMEGSFFLLLLVTLLLSFTALTLGVLLSAFANNELQMIQFIPFVIVPALFFSGLFDLDVMSNWVSWIGVIDPLNYAADAMKDIMIRGYGFSEIYPNLIVLIAFSLLFMSLNILALRKYRKG